MLACDIPPGDSVWIFYLLFGDELGGGFGYWLGKTAIEHSADGERYIDVLDHGSFPRAKAPEAVRVLDEVCGMRPSPDLLLLHERLRALEGA
jgi:hypothetical protein